MLDIRRIVDLYEIPDKTKISSNDIYRKFSSQFDKLFNGDEVAQTDEEFSQLYVHDNDFENSLNAFRTSSDTIARFVVGYTGIGKTTSIRYCFKLGMKKVPVLNSECKEIVFPTFLDGFREADKERFKLSYRIAAVSSALEKKHPELKEHLKTPDGKKELVEFIEAHTPYIFAGLNPIDAIDLDDEKLVKEKILIANKEYPFEFQANKLKFYIKKKYDEYERLIIILDDIESLSSKFQLEIMTQYLKLWECMKNTDYPDSGSYHIKLLISVRPHTHRSTQRIESFGILEPSILKREAIELSEFFERRFEHYTSLEKNKIGNKTTWENCYNELKKMNNSFDGQYKEMIKHLCFNNIRKALATYSHIFANRYWVQKNKKKEEYFTVNSYEYNFNNINVIRAMTCDEESVYWGKDECVVPNLLYTTPEEDYSIFCLLVIQYFYNKAQYDYYGVDAEKNSDIMEIWRGIFDNNTLQKMIIAQKYLYQKKVLRKSINDINDIDESTLDDESMLYISPRGIESFQMLGRDSVTFEMFRECAWRDYSGREQYSYYSSSELMGRGEQYLIFLDILEYLNYFCEREDEILLSIQSNNKMGRYKNAFGDTPVCSIILRGIKHSLDYSGMINIPNLRALYNSVQNRVLTLYINRK